MTPRSWTWAGLLLKALLVFEQHRIVHNDIKPENIFITERSFPKMDAASLQVLVLLKTRGKGSRSEGKALQRAAASARMWLESATLMDWVLRRMMQRLCEFGALQQHKVLQMHSFGLGLGKQRCMLLRIVAEACKLGGQLQ